MRFYHGGHIGDVIYSLYTIKKSGGGTLVLGPGQQHGWGDDEIDALMPLINYQDYVYEIWSIDKKYPDQIDHDFTSIRDIVNPEDFWEWEHEPWPGNAHLKKRYFNSLWRKRAGLIDQMLAYSNDDKWLTAPHESYAVFDIVFHAPTRKIVRGQAEWHDILSALSTKGFTILVIGGDDLDEWSDSLYYVKHKPANFLEVASRIDACGLFLGLASCNYVIAEGLDKFRLIDMAPATTGAEPMNERGWDITNWSKGRVIAAATRILEWHKNK